MRPSLLCPHRQQTSPECAHNDALSKLISPPSPRQEHSHSPLTQCSTDHTTNQREVQIFSPSVRAVRSSPAAARSRLPSPLPLALFAADIKFRLLVCRSTIVHSQRWGRRQR